MMKGKKANYLVVIENGKLMTYQLDDKNVWEVGRPTGQNHPDIRLYSSTVSRRHGKFENIDGVWFYIDNNGKNGTVYNEKHIKAGISGRTRPIMLSDGDVLIFGGGDEPVINSKTIWSTFQTEIYDNTWRVTDTKGMTEFVFTNGDNGISYKRPEKGMIVKQDAGMAIYMGELTYLSGDICVIGK